MNSDEFVDAVKLYVRDPAAEGMITTLKRPPGRKISLEERERSNWYNALSPEDTKYVNSIIAETAHAAVFGFFVVLDGDSKIVEEPGRFELSFVGADRTVLNDQRFIGLHELLNAVD